jgi:GH43 family beta-xylosidase
MSSPPNGNLETPGNPVIPIYAADPHGELLGDRYYIYATHAGIYSSAQALHDGTGGETHGFAAWSSRDLRHWTSEGPILHFANVPWASELGAAWAPCMAGRNGQFFFYFCAGSSIGVAVGDSPTGPFRDVLGEPMVPFREDMSSIDPMVFVDDDGQAYFYWGAVPGGDKPGRDLCMHLSVRTLNPDMVSFEGEQIPTIWTQKSPGGWHALNHIEASHVFKRNGIYYFMWSPGWFGSDDDSKTYRVHYATSSSPLGPWTEAANNPVLSSRREVEVIGPGHHSTIQIPGTDEWFCVYHCHKGDSERRAFIDRMTFDSEGAIETIIPTLEGPPLRAVRIELCINDKGPLNREVVRMEARLLGDAKANGPIKFFSGSNQIGQSAADSTVFEWRGAPVDFHRLSVRAPLSSGEVVTSAPLNFDVV